MAKFIMKQWQIEDAARLKKLMEASGYTQEAFGIEFGIGIQAMVGSYVNGRTPLNISCAVKFAKGLKCTIDQFSPTIADQIREFGTLVEQSEYVPRSKKSEAAAKIIDAMSTDQQDKAVKIVTTLAEPESNHHPLQANK